MLSVGLLCSCWHEWLHCCTPISFCRMLDALRTSLKIKKGKSHYIYKIHLFIVVVGRLYTVRRTNVPSRCHDRRDSFPAILFLLVNVQPLPRHCNETRLGLTVIWVFFLWDNWSAFALCFFRARRSFQFCRPQTFVCVNASPGRCSRLQQSGWEGVGLTTPSSALILYILSVKKRNKFYTSSS